ncbi:MAPEG family protein [Alteromonas gilva]|uniref:MAPEG family protein n=1 Tax=Alteromonas gilva TaxID=2987522 RepID=A0ABT5L7K3_9ALTE|nr:MAPEG family protein [Alteromonas gilva]MDC8831802.1 MAPEG family protein [Alteromonas gilva]
MIVLPVTAFYASVLAFVYLYLTALVIIHRRRNQIGVGDGGNEPLARFIRVHANFAEYVPLTLLLLAILEISIELPWLIHLFGGGLTLGRVLHAYGLSHSVGATWQRLCGMVLTLLTLAGLAAANLTLIYWLPFL